MRSGCWAQRCLYGTQDASVFNEMEEREFLFLSFVAVGFEIRASCLLGRFSTTPFLLYFSDRSLIFAWFGLGPCIPNSWITAAHSIPGLFVEMGSH
jgi:hypothetical protein